MPQTRNSGSPRPVRIPEIRFLTAASWILSHNILASPRLVSSWEYTRCFWMWRSSNKPILGYFTGFPLSMAWRAPARIAFLNTTHPVLSDTISRALLLSRNAPSSPCVPQESVCGTSLFLRRIYKCLSDAIPATHIASGAARSSAQRVSTNPDKTTATLFIRSSHRRVPELRLSTVKFHSEGKFSIWESVLIGNASGTSM